MRYPRFNLVLGLSLVVGLLAPTVACDFGLCAGMGRHASAVEPMCCAHTASKPSAAPDGTAKKPACSIQQTCHAALLSAKTNWGMHPPMVLAIALRRWLPSETSFLPAASAFAGDPGPPRFLSLRRLLI